MKRRLFAVCIVIVLLGGVFLSAASAEPYDGTVGSLNWSLGEDGTLTVSGSGPMPDYSPTGDAPWLIYRDWITGVTIAEGVSSVGDYAFLNCQQLRSCTLPESLYTVGIQSFANCLSLAQITLPAGLQSLGDYAFSGCSSLRSVEFLGDAPVIGGHSFSGVTASLRTHCTRNGWSAELADRCGGSLSWAEHLLTNETVTREPTCTEPGERVLTCGECGGAFPEPIPAKGHQKELHKAVPVSCTENGSIEYISCAVCGKQFSNRDCTREITEADILIPATGHLLVIDEEIPAGPETPGLTEGSHCGYCGLVFLPQEIIPALGYRAQIPGLSAGQRLCVNGIEYITDREGCIALPGPGSALAVQYHYQISGQLGSNLNWPLGFEVWELQYDGSAGFLVTRRPELDNLFLYCGSSVRNDGKRELRTVNAVNDSAERLLRTGQISGLTLEEYGTLTAWADVTPAEDLTIGARGAAAVCSWRSGVQDVYLYRANGLKYFTCEIAGLGEKDLRRTLLTRPYMVLTLADGSSTVLYGGITGRTAGYVALQNRLTYEPDTAAYGNIWLQIHNVYGSTYDAEYYG